MVAEGRSDRGRLWRLAAEASFTNPRITKTSNVGLQEKKAMSDSKGVKKKAIILKLGFAATGMSMRTISNDQTVIGSGCACSSEKVLCQGFSG